MRGPPFLALLVIAAVTVVSAGLVRAQQAPSGQPSAAELAKQLNNPISDLVSIPFQFNWAHGVGPDDATRFILNIQPVVPFHISKDWNMIGRFILPYINMPPLAPGGSTQSGTGDVTFSLFFSPRKGGVIWGVGPAFILPTTTNPDLGSGKWSVGPTAVVLAEKGHWTMGVLANQLWSVADNSNVNRASVNQAFIQPFFIRTSKTALSVGINSETIANWQADGSETWTVPINVFVSQVTKLGPFPFSVQGGVGYYVESPDLGPHNWQLRMNFTVLLPSK